MGYIVQPQMSYSICHKHSAIEFNIMQCGVFPKYNRLNWSQWLSCLLSANSTSLINCCWCQFRQYVFIVSEFFRIFVLWHKLSCLCQLMFLASRNVQNIEARQINKTYFHHPGWWFTFRPLYPCGAACSLSRRRGSHDKRQLSAVIHH